MKRPLQARSERSLQRILDAAESLLETSPFDRISVEEITRRAGVATGTFYTRFEDKGSLLAALFQRYLEDTERLAGEAEEGTDWSELPLEGRIRGMCELIVRTFRTRRGVSRAAQIHYHRFPESAGAEMRERLAVMYERFARIILGDGSEIEHENPAWAVRFALQCAVACCRAKILFNDHPVRDAAPANDRNFTAELTALVAGYLARRR